LQQCHGHDTHSVAAVESSASSKKGAPIRASLAPRLQCLCCVMARR
jgi:hypothetical protein